jgi:hypothetical protein
MVLAAQTVVLAVQEAREEARALAVAAVDPAPAVEPVVAVAPIAPATPQRMRSWCAMLQIRVARVPAAAVVWPKVAAVETRCRPAV